MDHKMANTSSEIKQFKGIIHRKMEILSLIRLLTLMLFQTFKTLVHLLKTNEDLLDEI